MVSAFIFTIFLNFSCNHCSTLSLYLLFKLLRIGIDDCTTSLSFLTGSPRSRDALHPGWAALDQVSAPPPLSNQRGQRGGLPGRDLGRDPVPVAQAGGKAPPLRVYVSQNGHKGCPVIVNTSENYFS